MRIKLNSPALPNSLGIYRNSPIYKNYEMHREILFHLSSRKVQFADSHWSIPKEQPMTASTKPTTTDAGAPVSSDEHSLTVGADGPIVLNDHYLIEQMANFNRER